MKVAPFRALTQDFCSYYVSNSSIGRNEGRPFQGIDTSGSGVGCGFSGSGRNEGRPFQGIDT